MPFGADVQQKIADLRSEIAAVAASDSDFPEIAAQLDGLVAELWDVIDGALAAAGEAKRCDPNERQEVG